MPLELGRLCWNCGRASPACAGRKQAGEEKGRSQDKTMDAHGSATLYACQGPSVLPAFGWQPMVSPTAATVSWRSMRLR
jgi:hypothetical protein